MIVIEGYEIPVEEARMVIAKAEKEGKVVKAEEEKYENEKHHEADLKWIGDEHLGASENWIPDATKQGSS